jgi:hypothetical protein
MFPGSLECCSASHCVQRQSGWVHHRLLADKRITLKTTSKPTI